MKSLPIHEALAKIEDDQGEWMPTVPGAEPANLPPAMVKLAQEIGTDEVLAEAALAWVRSKKQDVTKAKLVALYGQDAVQSMTEKLEGESKQ